MAETEEGQELGPTAADAEQNVHPAGGAEGEATQGVDESVTAGETSAAEVIDNSVETPSVLVPDVPPDEPTEKPAEGEVENSTEDQTGKEDQEDKEGKALAEASKEDVSVEGEAKTKQLQNSQDPMAEESESVVKSGENTQTADTAPENTETHPEETGASDTKEVADSVRPEEEATEEEQKEEQQLVGDTEEAARPTDSHVTATDTTDVKPQTGSKNFDMCNGLTSMVNGCYHA